MPSADAVLTAVAEVRCLSLGDSVGRQGFETPLTGTTDPHSWADAAAAYPRAVPHVPDQHCRS